MSDSPPINNENQDETAAQPAGWHQPSTPGAWRDPEPETPVSGWRVPTIPANLTEEPEDDGGWHKPDDSDTPFTPDDVTEMTVSPEDAEIIQQQPDAEEIDPADVAPEDDVPPEDATPAIAPEDLLLTTVKSSAPEETPTAPEDLIYMIEHLDEEEEDDFDRTSWTETLALQSLASADENPTIEQGAESPISAELALAAHDEDPDDDIDVQMLTPAERLAMGEPTGDTELVEGEVVEDDAASYARQQLAALQGLGGAGTATDTAPDFDEDDSAPTDVSDPESYARQQLAALLGDDAGGAAPASVEPTSQASGDSSDPASFAQQQIAALMNEQGAGGNVGMGVPTPTPAPAAAAPEELSPRETDLLNRYRQTEEQVRLLRQQYHVGQLSQDDFLARLRDLMILDDDQVWWMMGVETDTWYKSENNQWVEATPEVYDKERRVQASEGVQPAANVDEYGSIPYLSDTAPVDMGGTQPTYGEVSQPGPGGVEIDEFPLPRKVPINDPEATVPSPSVFNMNTQPSAAVTQPSASFTDATVMAQPVGYGTIESPIDATEPPAYDLDEDDDGEIYREARERQRRSTGRMLVFGGSIAAVLTFLLGAGFVGLSTLWYQDLEATWQEPVAALGTQETTPFQTVRILDRLGTQIATLGLEGEDRRPVSIGQVSPYMVHAVLSLEDTDFYSRGGWGFGDTLSGYTANLTGGDVGGNVSPITLAVARELVLRDTAFSSENERTLNETVVTNLIHEQFSYSQILEFYLNEVAYFGNLAYGVEAASQFYYNKSASELNYPEAALLAGLIDEPATYDPIRNRTSADARLDEVMNRMASVGCVNFAEPLPAGGSAQLCLSQDDLTSGETVRDKGALFLNLRTEERDIGSDYPHFVQLVQAQLENVYGNEMYRSGYVVTTTLNAPLQDSAERALRNQIDLLRVNNVNIGSVMVTDPRTGAIHVLVGSHDFNDTDIGGDLNQTLLYNEPGDLIDPIIYTMAFAGFDANGNGLEAGEYATTSTIQWDVPTTDALGQPVRNETGSFQGAITARRAFGNAINVTTLKTFQAFGAADNFRAVGTTMGLRFRDEQTFGDETAAGATPVRMFDLMEAYGTLANNGQLRTLFTIERIQDSNGNEIAVAPELASEPLNAIAPGVAYLVKNVMADDSARQPRFQANSPLTIPGVEVAARTATTRNASDLWTMGFTGNRVVGVWLGNHNDDPTFNNLTGFTAASPVFNSIMREALEGTEIPRFTPPNSIRTLQICSETGTIFEQGDQCATIINEVFIDGRFPPQEEGLIQNIAIDSWTGLIANEFCPSNIIEQTFVAIDDPSAIQWINNTNQGRQYAQRVGIPVPAAPAPTAACTQAINLPNPTIASPQGGQTVLGTTTITGQVPDLEFARYELQYAPAGTNNFQNITTSTSPQPSAGSALGAWDTTTIPNGQYTLRLAVFANNSYGGFIYRTVDITVNNPEPTPTPFPTQTPVPLATNAPPPAVPTQPLPFDTIVPTLPAGPTPTIDPLGG